MKWQCALIQRWLPDYPDGELSPFWKRRLTNHLTRCAACRQEWEEIQGVVAAIKAAQVADPGPEFWGEFSRDLHLKLARANVEQEGQPGRGGRAWWFRPLMVGVPVLALVVLWVAVHLNEIPLPGLPQAQKLAKLDRKPAPKTEVPKLAAKPPAPEPAEEQLSLVATFEEGAAHDDEFFLSSGDLEALLASMTDQEKEIFLKKLNQRERNGSWLRRRSSFFRA
jgi:hypothetical protein